MNLKQMLNSDPEKFISHIKDALGNNRLRALKVDDDEYQLFWLGVLEAIPNMRKDSHQIGYLILKGYGKIKNYRKSNYSRECIKYCRLCGRSYGFRKEDACKCGSDTIVVSRLIPLNDNYEYDDNIDIDMKVTIERFVNTLIGNMKYVAKRWLIDRADLMYNNYSKQLAIELEISPAMISKYVKKIRQRFSEWYNVG